MEWKISHDEYVLSDYTINSYVDPAIEGRKESFSLWRSRLSSAE